MRAVRPEGRLAVLAARLGPLPVQQVRALAVAWLPRLQRVLERVRALRPLPVLLLARRRSPCRPRSRPWCWLRAAGRLPVRLQGSVRRRGEARSGWRALPGRTLGGGSRGCSLLSPSSFAVDHRGLAANVRGSHPARGRLVRGGAPADTRPRSSAALRAAQMQKPARGGLLALERGRGVSCRLRPARLRSVGLHRARAQVP